MGVESGTGIVAWVEVIRWVHLQIEAEDSEHDLSRHLPVGVFTSVSMAPQSWSPL